MSDSRPGLVLGSSSPFRKALLERLGVPFETARPDLDEQRLPGEDAEALVQRLSEAKARVLAPRFPSHLIIGSDQVAVTEDGHILGKPHTAERAVEQLLSFSGRTVTFLTGLCLLNSASGHCQGVLEPFQVRFRPLTRAQVERYVALEQPLQCAGSFKSEGLGIVLFQSLHGRDPNSLVGLPLIALTDMLAQEGILLPLAE